MRTLTEELAAAFAASVHWPRSDYFAALYGSLKDAIRTHGADACGPWACNGRVYRYWTQAWKDCRRMDNPPEIRKIEVVAAGGAA